MSSTLSILGLYHLNNHIFDDMYVPDGIDKDLLIDNLIDELHELEVLYTDPNYMQFAIGKWSHRMQPTWDKLNALFNEEYDPLYNVDAHELTKETRNLATSNNDLETRDLATNANNTETRNLANSVNNTETRNLANTEDATNTHSVSGFNSNTFQNAEQDISDIDRSDTGTISNIGGGTDSGTISHAGGSTDTGIISHAGGGTDTGTIETEHRRYGNIGVTMAQDMILKEMQVRPDMNMYTYIIESFKQKFTLMIY